MISRWVWQLRAALSLYSSVKYLVVPYLIAVLIGTALEGLALGAVVPLIGGRGALSDQYARVLERVGVSPSEGALIGLIAVLFVARSFAQYLSALLGGLVVRRETVRLQVELFTLYLGVDWSEMVKRSRGEVNLLLNNQTHDVALFMYRVITLIEGVVYAMGLTAVAVVISPSNTLMAVGLIGLSLAGVGAISGRVRRYADAVLLKSQEQANRLLEYAAHAPLMRVYRVTDRAIADIRGRAEERERLAFKSQRIETLGWVLPDLLFVLALLTVVSLAYRSGDELAEIGAIIALLYRVSQYLKRFSDFSSLSATLPTIRAVHRFRAAFQANQAPNVDQIVDSTLPAGTVVVEDVSFRYDGAAAPALEHLSFTVSPGEFVGVAGPSGTGKSTLVQLIVGLLAPDDGRVRVGRTEHALNGIGYVPQTPVVISGTLASNVAWFREIPDADIEAACVAAGLQPLLDKLADGIQTRVGQDGLTLSGGERQRLALARALAEHPPILVLDEATSSLDAESEAGVQQAIEGLHGDVTVIAVAHRLASIMNADRVIVLERGSVREAGAPASLLSDRRTAFARLAMLQGIEHR